MQKKLVAYGTRGLVLHKKVQGSREARDFWEKAVLKRLNAKNSCFSAIYLRERAVDHSQSPSSLGFHPMWMNHGIEGFRALRTLSLQG